MTQKFTSDDLHANASMTHGVSASSAIAQGAAAGKDAIQSVTRELTGEVSHLASGIADEAKKAAEIKLGAGKDFAVEHLDSVADALRKTSKSLGQENVAAGYIEKAAGSVDRVSEYFQTRTLSQLVSDVEGYARREPAVFLGGAFFVGMLGGRFLKSAKPAPVSEGQSQGGARASQGQTQRNGNEGHRSSQGNRQDDRQGGNGHDNRSQGHASYGQHPGNQPQRANGGNGNGNGNAGTGSGGDGGQAYKQGSAQPAQKGASGSTGNSATAASSKDASRDDKPNDKFGSDSGFKSPDGANRPGKGSGAS